MARFTGTVPGLGNPYWLAVKAAIASFLALLVDLATDNPDHVSSTFVATLCVSPTALMGLRRAGQQLVGSVIGGLWGTLAGLVGLIPLFGIPLAVGFALFTAFMLRLSIAFPVIAFTALFVQAVPRGDPIDTLGVRFLAVMTGAVAGFLTNVLVSGAVYRQIFRRRLRLARELVLSRLPEAVDHGLEGSLAAFDALATLQRELQLAAEELTWRKNEGQLAQVMSIQRQVTALYELLHLMVEMHVEAHRSDLLRTEAPRAFATWLIDLDGDPPDLPPVFEETAERAILSRHTLAE